MLPTKFPALLLILIVRTCSAGLTIKTSKPDVSSNCVPAVVNVLTSCYSNRGNAIGIAGDMTENFLPTLWSKQLIPVVLFAGAPGTVPYIPVSFTARYKLQLFVIAIYKSSDFGKNFSKIRNSIYWNHMASLIILYLKRTSNNKCLRLETVFYTVWKLNVLNTIIMCPNANSELLTYAFNPYANEAPDHWPLLASYSTGVTKGGFHVYGPKYFSEKSNRTCESLDFDKMNNLAGHEIVVVYIGTPTYPWLMSADITMDSRDDNVYRLAIVQRAFNATIHVRNIDVDDVLYGHDVPVVIADRHADILINSFVNTADTGDTTMLYPHTKERLFILTNFRGHKSQLSKILFVIDWNSRVGLCLVLLITWMFFKCFVHQALMPAFLNIVRIVCNTGFENIPDNNATRLYLASVFMFVVTMQGIYQGQLAANLTNHVPIPDVNNLQELVDSEYTVYGFRTYARLFDDLNFENRFIRSRRVDCTEYVIGNSSNACIYFGSILVWYAKKLNLHISKDSVAQVDLSWPIRDQLPYIDKLNKLMMIIQATALREPILYRNQYMAVEEFVFDEMVKSNTGVKVIILENLVFAFVILGIGLAFATITFIVELAIGRFRSRVRTVRVQVLN